MLVLPVSKARGKVHPERPAKASLIPRDSVLAAGGLKRLDRDNITRALEEGMYKAFGPGVTARGFDRVFNFRLLPSTLIHNTCNSSASTRQRQ
jgi:hypothetical protein